MSGHWAEIEGIDSATRGNGWEYNRKEAGIYKCPV